ncbi:MAG: hypothetical protein JOS17DRAFT_794451 [Linnemannia elongata]|nr:MAG: hypothetical protein JOS17DRAFT_794451 [Linnemannia elongata]
MTDNKIITDILLSLGKFLDKSTLNSCLRLDELDIRGAWYHDLAQPTNEQWKLKNLTLDWIDSPFLKNCVALESLSIPQMLKVGNGSDYGINPFLMTVLKELQTMPKMNTIIFEGVGNAVDDIFERQGPENPSNTAADVWNNTVGEWEGQQFTLWEIVCFLEVMTPCHLPAEIIFSVGEYLDGPSLYACLQTGGTGYSWRVVFQAAVTALFLSRGYDVPVSRAFGGHRSVHGSGLDKDGTDSSTACLYTAPEDAEPKDHLDREVDEMGCKGRVHQGASRWKRLFGS